MVELAAAEGLPWRSIYGWPLPRPDGVPGPGGTVGRPGTDHHRGRALANRHRRRTGHGVMRRYTCAGPPGRSTRWSTGVPLAKSISSGSAVPSYRPRRILVSRFSWGRAAWCCWWGRSVDPGHRAGGGRRRAVPLRGGPLRDHFVDGPVTRRDSALTDAAHAAGSMPIIDSRAVGSQLRLDIEPPR